MSIIDTYSLVQTEVTPMGGEIKCCNGKFIVSFPTGAVKQSTWVTLTCVQPRHVSKDNDFKYTSYEYSLTIDSDVALLLPVKITIPHYADTEDIENNDMFVVQEDSKPIFINMVATTYASFESYVPYMYIKFRTAFYRKEKKNHMKHINFHAMDKLGDRLSKHIKYQKLMLGEDEYRHMILF